MSLPQSSSSEASFADNSTKKESRINDLFGAAALAADLNVPVHLKTKTRRWLVLILVSLSSAWASGPLQSWPTLEPILIREHVFTGPGQMDKLSQVYSIAVAMQVLSGLPTGMVYDVFGPRWAGVVGALGCAVSLLCMAVSVKVTSMNWLLWISYPATMFFGSMNSTAAYAWYWLLPEHQNAGSSVVGFIQVLSDSFVLLAVWLNHDFGFSMPAYFLILSGMACVAGLIAFCFVPTFDENTAHAAAIVEYQFFPASSANPADGQDQVVESRDPSHNYFGGEGEEAADMREARSANESAVGKTISNIKAAFTWWVRLYPTVNILFNLYMFAWYMWTVYPQLKMLQIYTGLLGPETAQRLVNLYGGVYPVVGVIFVLSLGPFVDMVGYRETIALLILPTVLLACLIGLRSFDAQVVVQVILSCLTNAYYVISPRFCLHYSPPDLFGTVFGIQGVIVGLGQLIGTPVATLITRAFEQSFNLKGSDGATYLIATYFWGVLHVGTVIALLLYWWYHPLPAVGSCTMEDIRTVTFSADAIQSRHEAREKCGPLQESAESTNVLHNRRGADQTPTEKRSESAEVPRKGFLQRRMPSCLRFTCGADTRC